MPYLMIQTNLPLGKKAERAILKNASTLVAEQLEKPESFVMIALQPDTPIIDETFRFVGPSINPQSRSEEFPFEELGQGPLELTARAGQTPRRFYIEGGVAQMKDNHLTVLTQIAIPAGEISAESARAELAEATAQRVVDETSFEDRQRRMQRARAMEALANQR